MSLRKVNSRSDADIESLSTLRGNNLEVLEVQPLSNKKQQYQDEYCTGRKHKTTGHASHNCATLATACFGLIAILDIFGLESAFEERAEVFTACAIGTHDPSTKGDGDQRQVYRGSKPFHAFPLQQTKYATDKR